MKRSKVAHLQVNGFCSSSLQLWDFPACSHWIFVGTWHFAHTIHSLHDILKTLNYWFPLLYSLFWEIEIIYKVDILACTGRLSELTALACLDHLALMKHIIGLSPLLFSLSWCFDTQGKRRCNKLGKRLLNQKFPFLISTTPQYWCKKLFSAENLLTLCTNTDAKRKADQILRFSKVLSISNLSV